MLACQHAQLRFELKDGVRDIRPGQWLAAMSCGLFAVRVVQMVANAVYRFALSFYLPRLDDARGAVCHAPINHALTFKAAWRALAIIVIVTGGIYSATAWRTDGVYRLDLCIGDEWRFRIMWATPAPTICMEENEWKAYYSHHQTL